MKVIEIVFLIGTQCMSPIQNSPGLTEAAKVQCAVVIEMDSESRQVRISPESAAGVPKVMETVQRLTMPVAAAAPPPQQTAKLESDAGAVRVVVPAPPSAVPQDLATEPPAPAPEPDGKPAAAPAPKIVATLTPETAEVPPADPPTQKKKPGVETRAGEPTNICGAGRKAVWYTASPGHRKYRCRSASASGTVKPVAARKGSKSRKKGSVY